MIARLRKWSGYLAVCLGLVFELACIVHAGPGQPAGSPAGRQPSALGGASAGNQAASIEAPPLPELLCPLAAATQDREGALKGQRRLALIVGVGTYKNHPQPRSLPGPPNDADRMYRLLTDPEEGFGFPKGNVCLVKNEQATLAEFERLFNRALVDRAQDGDVVVLFFAGHGSQARDGNFDEPDGMDETLMLSDARFQGVPDLVDDKLSLMLGSLFQKMSGPDKPIREQNVTVMLDSCNSGTANRSDLDEQAVVRYFDPSKETLDIRSGLPKAGPGGARWDGVDLPGLVFLSGAADGTAAKEDPVKHEGYFTTAMVQVLKEAGRAPLTYDQLGLRLAPLVAVKSDQKVHVQGGPFTSRLVFRGSTVTRPSGYLVKEIQVDTGTVILQGAPLPGWSPGATIRIYNWPPGTGETSMQPGYLKDPSRSKASCVVTEQRGIDSVVAVVAPEERERLKAINTGDLAVLAFGGRESASMRVRIVPGSEPGGVSTEQIQRIFAQIDADPALKRVVQVIKPGDKAADVWQISLNGAGCVQLTDPSGTLRTPCRQCKDTQHEPEELARILGQFARQKALLQLRGEDGQDFKNDATLQVKVAKLPLGRTTNCDRSYALWEERPAGTPEVRLPLGACWQVQVSLAADAPNIKLYVGGVYLLSDGGIHGFPNPSPPDNEQEFLLLQPGKTVTWTFNAAWTTTPPINVPEHVLVFGSREAVKWSDLTTPDAGVKKGGETGGMPRLMSVIAQYLDAERGERVILSQPTTWTSSHVTILPVANAGFDLSAGPVMSEKREYTGPYDIREQLPANKSSALYQLLTTTDKLTNWYDRNGQPDGSRYKQDHVGRWEKLKDEQNMAQGFDCSRAIWYAFTRSGLQYNNGHASNPEVPAGINQLGRYLSTWEMIDVNSSFLDEIGHQGRVGESPMRDQFLSCKDDPVLRPGDLLVYRRMKGAGKVDGHVVMVIDPEKAVAWGSHAWDGSAQLTASKADVPDTGVEYQRILRVKSGQTEKWGAWDKSNMIRVECWRHKQLAREWEEDKRNRPACFDSQSDHNGK